MLGFAISPHNTLQMFSELKRMNEDALFANEPFFNISDQWEENIYFQAINLL